uniref:ACB domain-containing protein n=1 Tax=Tetradesmus obliquus TaxID=3088 RepID=A0A383VFQ0_TETOB|eukprot:jgi/Sobl393_1/5452/SZX64378.1
MASDIGGAVAALQAAGEGIDALITAVGKAKFLDETPGEDRQKLRAARTKLRKLLAAREAGGGTVSAGAAAAAAGVPAEKSPHMKTSYDAVEFDTLADVYEGLKWRMISKPGGATVKPDDFYRLYALQQQASQGDNTTERPMWAEKGGLDFKGRARWDAWAALKGLASEEAKLRFVKLFYEFPPSALYSDTRGGVTA